MIATRSPCTCDVYRSRRLTRGFGVVHTGSSENVTVENYPELSVMTFREYMQRAARTLPDDLGSRDLLADAALGLCGEAEEIDTASSTDARDDEIGDGWWYVAAICHALAIEPESIPPHASPADAEIGLFRSACRIAERAKKVRYHREAIDRHRDAILEQLGHYASSLSERTPTSKSAIWSANLEKLASRYPDGFEPARD